MSEKENILEHLPYWSRLTESEKAAVRQCAVTQKFAPGQQIFNGGDGCLGMVLMLRGCVRVYMLSEEGREITLFRIREGDPCVMSATCVISQLTFETQMVAEESAEMLIVNSGVFGQLCEDNIYVRCFSYELITERFSAVMWTLQEILFKGFDRRLASFLVREYDRTGADEIKMTHEQIAQSVNSAREVVARMVKRFSDDGLIETRRGLIKLRDIKALRLLAK